MQTKAEDNAWRFESVDVVDLAGEEQGQSNVKVMCQLCFSGENEGSDRARKMLSCKSCGKKYHRLCLKAWAQHRDEGGRSKILDLGKRGIRFASEKQKALKS